MSCMSGMLFETVNDMRIQSAGVVNSHTTRAVESCVAPVS